MGNRHKIVAGLREAISYAKGDNGKARVTVFNVPENIEVKKVRESLKMTQAEFALKFGFSLGTLRQWEQGRRHPDGAARVLLTVIKREPGAVNTALMMEADETPPPKKIAAG
jgi:putative transcriptional regulator